MVRVEVYGFFIEKNEKNFFYEIYYVIENVIFGCINCLYLGIFDLFWKKEYLMK